MSFFRGMGMTNHLIQVSSTNMQDNNPGGLTLDTTVSN